MFRRTLLAGVLFFPTLRAVGTAQSKPDRLEVFPGCAVDLARSERQCLVTLDADDNEPSPHPKGKDLDLWFMQDGKLRYLVPERKVLVGKPVRTEPALTTCVILKRQATRPIKIDARMPIPSICVVTPQGNTFEVELTFDNETDRLSLRSVKLSR
jgi:hypothetical protein